MNGAVSQQLLVGGLVSFSTYTVSVMWQANEHLAILGGIYDPVIQPGEFSTPFDEIGLFSVLELTSDRGGTARFLGVYDNSDGIAFDNPRLILDEVLGIDAETKLDLQYIDSAVTTSSVITSLPDRRTKLPVADL